MEKAYIQSPARYQTLIDSSQSVSFLLNQIRQIEVSTEVRYFKCPGPSVVVPPLLLVFNQEMNPGFLSNLIKCWGTSLLEM